MKQVLIIEDDHDIVDLLKIHLKDLECEVDEAFDGLTGEQKALKGKYDLIILDVMLPGKDGNAIAQKLRALDIYTPILMLTARTEEIDKVLGRPVMAGAALKKWMENASKAPKEEMKEEEKVE